VPWHDDKSYYPDLQPDIRIRVGEKPVPCTNCGARAIYALGEQILCRTCGSEVQEMINRMHVNTILASGTIGGINRSTHTFWQNQK